MLARKLARANLFLESARVCGRVLRGGLAIGASAA